MPNNTFADRADFLDHIVLPLGFPSSRGADLYRAFWETGYVASQDEIGIGVKPRLQTSGMNTALVEGDPNVAGHHRAVMLSNPAMSVEEYDRWAGIVRNWVAGLSFEVRRAYSRKIRLERNVEDGIPLQILNDAIPAELLLTFRRPADFVIVIEKGLKRKRAIYSTKGIG
jgi:hypothetical protein